MDKKHCTEGSHSCYLAADAHCMAHCTAQDYCVFCGKEKRQYYKQRYDSATGEKTIGIRCENPACERGCENTSGHNYKFLTGRCKSCGTYRPDDWF